MPLTDQDFMAGQTVMDTLVNQIIVCQAAKLGDEGVIVLDLDQAKEIARELLYWRRKTGASQT